MKRITKAEAIWNLLRGPLELHCSPLQKHWAPEQRSPSTERAFPTGSQLPEVWEHCRGYIFSRSQQAQNIIFAPPLQISFSWQAVIKYARVNRVEVSAILITFFHCQNVSQPVLNTLLVLIRFKKNECPFSRYHRYTLCIFLARPHSQDTRPRPSYIYIPTKINLSKTF